MCYIFCQWLKIFYHDCIVFLCFLKVIKTSYLWMAMRKVNSKKCPSGVVEWVQAEEGDVGGDEAS